MSTKEAATAPAIYQLKITLRGSRPPIWRRIQVRGNTSLAKLHDIIQIVMGWTNSHLHQFQIGEKYYSDPQFDWASRLKSTFATNMTSGMVGITTSSLKRFLRRSQTLTIRAA